jgi:hypothetical protein
MTTIKTIRGETPEQIASNYVKNKYFNGVLAANYLVLFDNLTRPIRDFIQDRFIFDDEVQGEFEKYGNLLRAIKNNKELMSKLEEYSYSESVTYAQALRDLI